MPRASSISSCRRSSQTGVESSPYTAADTSPKQYVSLYTCTALSSHQLISSRLKKKGKCWIRSETKSSARAAGDGQKRLRACPKTKDIKEGKNNLYQRKGTQVALDSEALRRAQTSFTITQTPFTIVRVLNQVALRVTHKHGGSPKIKPDWREGQSN